jgi:hypothetical protein
MSSQRPNLARSSETRFALGEIFASWIESQADMVFIVDVRLFGDDGEDLDLKVRGRLRALLLCCGGVPTFRKGCCFSGSAKYFVQRASVSGSSAEPAVVS